MKILAVTQARFSSTRLPGKVLMPLGSSTVLDLHLKRIKKSKLLTHFVVATTEEKESKEIETIALKNDFKCFHGSMDDVLDRFYQAAKEFQPDYVVRLTSDCPLIDAFYIDDLIKIFLEKKVDYASNCMVPTLPDGMDAEIFTFDSLKIAREKATKKSEREHVTPFIRESGEFNVYSVEYTNKLGQYRLTLDTEEDFDLIDKLVEKIGENGTMEEYIDCLIKNPSWIGINSKYERNEGLKKSLEEDKKRNI